MGLRVDISFDRVHINQNLTEEIETMNIANVGAPSVAQFQNSQKPQARLQKAQSEAPAQSASSEESNESASEKNQEAQAPSQESSESNSIFKSVG